MTDCYSTEYFFSFKQLENFLTRNKISKQNIIAIIPEERGRSVKGQTIYGYRLLYVLEPNKE